MYSNELVKDVADGHDLPEAELELYGEPMTRQDGTSFAAVMKTSEPQAVIIAYELPGGISVTVRHDKEEIHEAFEGSFEQGIMQVMKTYIAQPLPTLETIEWPLPLQSAAE